MMVGSNVAVALPGCVLRWYNHTPFSVSNLSRAATSTPQERANPKAALVGWPFLSNAAAIAGPLLSICRSACPVAMPSMNTAKRRGVANGIAQS